MIVELRGAKATAKINTLGAELFSFCREDGLELLWQGDPEYWEDRAPVLFPIVGSLRKNRVKIKGEWYVMKCHGFAKLMEFTVTDRREESVTLTLASDEATKEYYPYEFRLHVTYTLKENSIETRFTVENPGSETLPFVIGGHPGFRVPLEPEAGETFEDYEIRFSRPETQICPEVDAEQALIDPTRVHFTLNGEQTIPLKHSLFYPDALIFEGLASETVSLISRKSGRGVEMEIGEFPMLGIWCSLNDGAFVALEPWVGCATAVTEDDEFLHKKNMLSLPAGEKTSRAFTVKYL